MKKLSNEELLAELEVPFPVDQVLWRFGVRSLRPRPTCPSEHHESCHFLGAHFVPRFA